MDDKWLNRIAGKYVQFRVYKDTLHFTTERGWVEDNPKNPRHVTIQLDSTRVEDSHHLYAMDIQYVQCVLPDKINEHRTITYLCGGKCPVKGVEVYRSDVECQGYVIDASEYS